MSSKYHVESSVSISASADQVWSAVRDFCGVWHPAISTMTAEYDDTGHLLRAFTVHGEDTVYRERLTWFSDSERSMAYTHVDGIEGVDSYHARMEVTADEKEATACRLTLAATLRADEPRATEINNGTQAIFDSGTAAIKAIFEPASDSTTSPSTAKATPPELSPGIAVPQQPTAQRIHTHYLDGSPTLALSVIDGPAHTRDSLCLFLHGIGGNRSNWNAQLTATSDHCTAAAMDLRGYGDSALGETQSTVDDYCADILRAVESLKTKKLVLCGLSYGAWIATSFAMRYPQHLSALVLSGGCTGMSEASVEERESFLRSREAPLAEGKTPADFAAAVVDVISGPQITDAAKHELLSSMQAISSDTYADALRCFTHPTETFDFSRLSIPVLLMTGDADRLAPPQEIKQVAARIHKASPVPDVRFECVSGAGHVCNLEAPDTYNKALVELIKRVS